MAVMANMIHVVTLTCQILTYIMPQLFTHTLRLIAQAVSRRQNQKLTIKMTVMVTTLIACRRRVNKPETTNYHKFSFILQTDKAKHILKMATMAELDVMMSHLNKSDPNLCNVLVLHRIFQSNPPSVQAL